MSQKQQPQRKNWQFSFAQLFISLTVVCCLFAALHYFRPWLPIAASLLPFVLPLAIVLLVVSIYEIRHGEMSDKGRWIVFGFTIFSDFWPLILIAIILLLAL